MWRGKAKRDAVKKEIRAGRKKRPLIRRALGQAPRTLIRRDSSGTYLGLNPGGKSARAASVGSVLRSQSSLETGDWRREPVSRPLWQGTECRPVPWPKTKRGGQVPASIEGHPSASKTTLRLGSWGWEGTRQGKPSEGDWVSAVLYLQPVEPLSRAYKGFTGR